VDSAYVDAQLLVSSRRDYDISLEGPVRGMLSWQARLGQGYDLPNFVIDWNNERITCPQGKTSQEWRIVLANDGSARVRARFRRTDCTTCPARSACTPSKDSSRSVGFHMREEHEALESARARMHEPS